MDVSDSADRNNGEWTMTTTVKITMPDGNTYELPCRTVNYGSRAGLFLLAGTDFGPYATKSTKDSMLCYAPSMASTPVVNVAKPKTGKTGKTVNVTAAPDPDVKTLLAALLAKMS